MHSLKKWALIGVLALQFSHLAHAVDFSHRVLNEAMLTWAKNPSNKRK